VVRRRIIRAAPWLAVALAAGCSGKMFHPRTAREASDADARVRIESVYATKFPGTEIDEHIGVRLYLKVERAPGASLGRARLTSTRLAPCDSGLVANEPDTMPDRWGPETQVLAFSRPAAVSAGLFDDGSAALDVAVFSADHNRPGQCLRIPLFDNNAPTLFDEPAWANHPVLFGGEERLAFLHSDVPGLKSPALLLGVGFGAWSGRWRWMLEFEGGFSDRADTLPSPPGVVPSGRPSPLFGLIGGGASVSTLLVSRGHFGLGALGGYDVLHGIPSGGDGPKPESLLLHGPRVGLRFMYLIDPLKWPGFESPLDASTGALAIYAGDWWNGSDVGRQSPFVGVALEGNVGF
jgi:hypothetical protein